MDEYSEKRKLFGDFAEIAVYDTEEDIAKGIVEDVYKEGLRLQKIFNFYDKKSELSVLNRNKKKRAPDELLYVIKKALEYCALTNGKYDISLGSNFLRRKKGLPDEKISCSYKDIRIKGNEVSTGKNVMIDLGSIAKGYIVDRMIEKMKEMGVMAGMIDARGDIRSFGKDEEILVKNPRKEGFVKKFKIRDKAVATSGDYMQYSGSYEKSHLVNKNGVIAATVVANNLMEADLFATLLCVYDKRNSLIKDKEMKALAIDNDLNISYYNWD